MPGEVAGRRGARLQGDFRRARGILVGEVAHVVVGAVEVQGQATQRHQGAFQLHPARAHRAGVGQVLHAVGFVVGVGLVAMHLGPEQVGIELQAAIPEGALEAQLGIVGALGANQQRVGTGHWRGRHRQVDPAGLLAMGQGGVTQQIVGKAITQVQQA
ncbi:hypothetical protein D3C77_415390 [compost metagenome]